MSDERPDPTNPADQLLDQVDAAAVRAAIRSDRQPDEGRRDAYESLNRLVRQRDAYKERAEKAEGERDRWKEIADAFSSYYVVPSFIARKLAALTDTEAGS